MPSALITGTSSGRLERAVDTRVQASARDPVEVARVIADALTTRRPRFRYPVGPDARIGHLLKGVIPTRLRRRLIARYLGLRT